MTALTANTRSDAHRKPALHRTGVALVVVVAWVIPCAAGAEQTPLLQRPANKASTGSSAEKKTVGAAAKVGKKKAPSRSAARTQPLTFTEATALPQLPFTTFEQANPLFTPYWLQPIIGNTWAGASEIDLRAEVKTMAWKFGAFELAAVTTTVPGRERLCAPSCSGVGWQSELRLRWYFDAPEKPAAPDPSRVRLLRPLPTPIPFSPPERANSTARTPRQLAQ